MKFKVFLHQTSAVAITLVLTLGMDLGTIFNPQDQHHYVGTDHLKSLYSFGSVNVDTRCEHSL